MNKDTRALLAKCFFRRKHSPSIELMNEITNICHEYYLDTAIEAILSLPARNLTRQQAIQVINKAFSSDG